MAGRTSGPWPKYPFLTWFSKKRFKVTPGKHFTCKTKCMDVYLRQKSLDLGYQISIATLEDGSLKVTVHGRR